MTSNSSHITYVGFYPFQVPYHYHDRITSMCHVFFKFQFISSTCMTCQIIFKTNLYIYNGKSEHIKYRKGQIRLIHCLIHLVIVLLNFSFQKCRDLNPRLDPVGGSKPEPGLLRHFQLSSQNILFGFIKFFIFKSVATRIPNSTWLVDPNRSSVYSDIFNYLLKTFCLVLLKFSFSKVSRPESPTRPGWWIQAGARFTLTFSIIFSKHFVWFY